MVALGSYLILVTVIGFFLRNKLMEYPIYLKVMMLSIPLAELGRQPWIVYGLMKTSDGVSPIAISQVAGSLVAFLLVYGLLGAVGYYLIGRKAINGPEPA